MLKPVPDKSYNICEVGVEAKNDFFFDLNLFFSGIIAHCEHQLGISKLNIVSVKLQPMKKQVRIIANIILAEDQMEASFKADDKYRKVEFSDEHAKIKDLAIHRLIKWMEAKAMQDRSKDFESLLHVRVIPCENEDLTAEKF
jgi:hypothetical protein